MTAKTSVLALLTICLISANVHFARATDVNASNVVCSQHHLTLPAEDDEAARHTLDDHHWAQTHPQEVRKYNEDYEKLFAASRHLKCLSPNWEKGLIYTADKSRAHIPWSWVR